MTLAYHIRKWWDVANDRRQRLIVKKHKGGGLSRAQDNELFLLQAVAEEIINHAGRDVLVRCFSQERTKP